MPFSTIYIKMRKQVKKVYQFRSFIQYYFCCRAQIFSGISCDTRKLVGEYGQGDMVGIVDVITGIMFCLLSFSFKFIFVIMIILIVIIVLI